MLEFLKELFGENALTLEQLETLISERGKDKLNIVNLAGGNYVSKSKYEDDVNDRDTQIKALNSKLSDRDKDLKELKKQLEKAGTDETALGELQKQFDSLKENYAKDKQDWEANLAKTKYESAVKEYASGFNFTSPAAKRDFISQMINKSLALEEGKIIGADDFYNSYKAENEASFVVEKQEDPKHPQPAPEMVKRDSTPPPEHKLTLSEQMRIANEQNQ